MSDSQPIDLSELQSLSFRPDWVGEKKPESNAPAAEVVWNFTEARGGRSGGRDDRGPRGDRPQNRGPRNDGGRGFGGPGQNRGGGNERRGPGGPGGAPGGPRRDARPGGPPGPGGFGNRPPGGGNQGGDRRPQDRGPRPEGDRGPRPEGNRPEGNRGPRRDGARPGGDRNQGRRDERRFDDRPRLPDGWFVRLLPEPRAVEALSKQIKASGRAYSVFDVAKLFLSGRDRYLLHFYFKKSQPNQEQPKDAPPVVEAPAELLQCTLDGSLWLTREEAIRHIRESGAMNELYREEVVEIDPPKGVFQSIAVCGFSGALLGPPNHHSFPVNVARLHREEFYNLPIDRYKARIQIEKGEEIVAKWLEQQSKERQYVATKVAEGEEAPRFKTIAERDAHFFKNHADEVLKSVREVTVNGNIPGKHLSPGLLAVLRMELDRQNRFPMHLVQELCRELENHGLRFFKRDKKTTFVCRSRPQFIGTNITLSDRVRAIVEMIRANPGIGYGKVVSVLAPPAAPVEAAPVAEGEAAVAETVPTLSTGELAIMQDIKWLVQEGFLTEFANGELHILGRERPHDEGREGQEKKGGKQKGSKPAPAEGSTESSPEAESSGSTPADSDPVATEVADTEVVAESLAAIEPEPPAAPEAAVEAESTADAIEPALEAEAPKAEEPTTTTVE